MAILSSEDGSFALRLVVNGEPIELNVDVHETLLDLLRRRLRLTGAKAACMQGECGACTVLVDGMPIYACMTLAVQMQDRQITTIEGIHTDQGDYHLLQRAFIETDAIQCGFCTPAMILTAMALLQTEEEPSAETIRRALAGNLCLCAGYQRIVKAVLHAAQLRKRRADDIRKTQSFQELDAIKAAKETP